MNKEEKRFIKLLKAYIKEIEVGNLELLEVKYEPELRRDDGLLGSGYIATGNYTIIIKVKKIK